MKLKKQDIEKMIHNVLSYEFDDTGCLHFKRFTDSQLEVYKAASQGWFERANASASVTFDFVTDSDYIAMKVKLHSGSSENSFSFDLCIDGILYEHREMDRGARAVVGFDLPKGEHRVTIYFPWTKETVVEEVHLTDGACIEEVKKRAKWLILGDSLTQGEAAKLTSLTAVNSAARVLDLEVVNQGVGGYRFDAETLDESIVSYEPDILTVTYGSNDYTIYDYEEDFRRHASEYIEKLVTLFPSTPIIGVLPLYRFDQKTQIKQKYCAYTLNDARRILKELYQKYDNITVLEEAGIPRVPEMYQDDCVHLNELGFSFYANALEKRMKELQIMK